LSRCGWRQRFAIALEGVYPLLDNLTEFGIDLGFVAAVAAGSDHSGTLAHKTLVLVRPFDDLDVPGTLIHDVASSMALFTSRS
jgi:hypothetical protein